MKVAVDEKKVVFTVFLLFFLFLLLQYSRIPLYSDDYGYGSLSYAAQSDKEGIWEFLDYLRLHYLNWGGRILYYSVLICGVRAGLWVIRILQSVVILADYILIYELCCFSSQRINKISSSILVCLFYGIFEIAVAQQSLYWFSAAITYTLPFCTFCIFFLKIYKIGKDRILLPKKVLCLSGLGFIVGFSQEQYAISACVLYGYFYLVNLRKQRKNIKSFWIIGVFLAIGSAMLILAPGNFARSILASGDAISINAVLTRIQNIISIIFSGYMKIFMLTLTMALAIFTIKQISIKKMKLLYVFLFFWIMIIGIIIISGPLLKIGIENKQIFWVLSYIYFPMAIFEIFLCLLKNLPLNVVFFIIGIFSAIIMISTSEISPRTMVPLILFSLPFILENFSSILKFKLNYIISFLFSIVMILNLWTIFMGYQKNYMVNKINWMKLNVSSYEKTEKIYLYKNVDDQYSYVQPYMYDGFFKGQEQLIKNYFGIDSSVEIEWIDPLDD